MPTITITTDYQNSLYSFHPKHIDHIRIWATEVDLAIAGRGWSAAIAEDIDSGNGNVHGHGAEFSTLGIVVEGVTDLMPSVATVSADPVHQGNSDSWFTHRRFLSM